MCCIFVDRSMVLETSIALRCEGHAQLWKTIACHPSPCTVEIADAQFDVQ
jgi:hypothetical protein